MDEYLFGEYLSSVFCDEDQMYVHLKYAMSTATNTVFIFHRPSIQYVCAKDSSLPIRLMPSGDQQRHMRGFAGSGRFVFNKALALQTAHHAAGNKFIFIRYVEMANMLPLWKSEFRWLRESPSQALQHALKNLDGAFVNFFQNAFGWNRLPAAQHLQAICCRPA